MALPERTARISDDLAAEILRLQIRGLSQRETARRLKVSRGTVARVLERTGAALAVVQDVAAERGRALAVLREVQAEAWRGIDGGRPPAALLSVVIGAQERINRLLGIEPPEQPDAMARLAAFKAGVLTAVEQEAPEVAARLASRLLATATGESNGHRPDRSV